jgi:thiosulfate dehydrogenase
MNWSPIAAIAVGALIVAGGVGLAQTLPGAAPAPAPAAKAAAWVVPDVDALPSDAWGRMVRLGRDLTTKTPTLIGPAATDPAKHYAGNNLTCQSCHLEAGTKQFGLPFVGVFADFPQYRAREGEVGSLEDRINGCMARSMAGRVLPIDSLEMKAFVAYIKFLSTGIAIGKPTPAGRGSGALSELTRPADPAAGARVYAANCVACHGADGMGKRAETAADGKIYDFPPLWGPDSFNDGAGMARLISAAGFIRSNMPFGTTADKPVLSEEDAWDVAAFVEAHARPQKDHLDKDYPVRLEKAVDAAYGPFADGLPPDQHKYGPYPPIREKVKALKQAGVKVQ